MPEEDATWALSRGPGGLRAELRTSWGRCGAGTEGCSAAFRNPTLAGSGAPDSTPVALGLSAPFRDLRAGTGT